MLQDFNQALGNDLVRGGTAWKTNPGDSKSAVQFRLESSHRRGESGNALYFSYTLNPAKAAINGFRLYLKGLDAAAYDHLEFWVKGDRRKGFADAFKVKFKRPYPDGSGVMEKGSYVVTGITDDWQRIRVPRNFMNGIKDWTNLKEFNIIFQSRRAAVKAGAYYLDDVALLATGNPGPGIRDKVIAVRKRFNYVPSWGGSLFEALMPVLVLDEQRYAPHNLGLNDAVHAAVHQRYALAEHFFE